METHLDLNLCDYKNHKYITYIISEKDKKTTFHNAAYTRFSVISEEFESIMHHIGGFTANVTTRHIDKLKKEKDYDIASILLCCIPQKTNRFVFWFVYLDKDDNIKDYMSDDNYFDYQYLYQKFKEIISEEGMVFDLITNQKFTKIADAICPQPSLDFDISVENRKIKYDDTLIYNSLDIYNENTRKTLEHLHAQYTEFHFDCDTFRFIHLKGTIFDENNEPIKRYQMESGMKDIEEHFQYMKNKYPDYKKDAINTDNMEITINIKTARIIAPKMHLSNHTQPDT